MHDYLIVGSGLFGATFAYQMKKIGKSCLIIEKRNHIGGNVYTQQNEGIDVHVYGPHFFHTNNEKVWKFINRFSTFYNYCPKVKVKYKNSIYSFPINLFTLNQLWGVETPEQAQQKLNQVKIPISHPENLEEWALSEIGQELYEIFYKGYTAKQWGKPCQELPATIIKRLPIRLTYNDSYHSNCKYQGIPSEGYTTIIEKMLKGIEVKTNFDFFSLKNEWKKIAKKLVFTGPIDQFFNFKFGKLEYRSLSHEHKVFEGDYQGNHQINYTELEIPYTRVIEHKHFNPFKEHKHTVVTWETPSVYDGINEPFYPIGDDYNHSLYQKYADLANQHKDIIISGRLGSYKYIDMDTTIAMALQQAQKENQPC